MGENTRQNCTRQNKNKEDPGRQQPCWGFLFCTKLTQPTGALDSRSTDQLLDLFQSINEDGQTIVMVTHSTKAASRAKRVLFIKDGEVFHQIYKANMSDEEMYAKISAALTVLATGGEQGE